MYVQYIREHGLCRSAVALHVLVGGGVSQVPLLSQSLAAATATVPHDEKDYSIYYSVRVRQNDLVQAQKPSRVRLDAAILLFGTERS